jgi:probable phosphoglycerate mutase
MHPMILVRHGQAEHNVSDLNGGWSQTGLTELGVRQARAVARRLSDELRGQSIRLVASDLRRTRETAEIVSEALGVRPEYNPGIRECNNGVAADKTKQEVRELYVEPREPLLDWRPYPGSETWREFHRRVSEAMGELVEGNDRVMVAVTHGGTIVQIISWWLRLTPEQMVGASFKCEPAGLAVLKVTELRERMVERLNDTQHLAELGGYNPIRLQHEPSGRAQPARPPR